MTKNQLKKKFIKFLKEKDAFVPFCVNLCTPNWCGGSIHKINTKGMRLSTYLNSVPDPRDWFFESFSWPRTIQGWWFWDQLDIKWKDYVFNFQH